MINELSKNIKKHRLENNFSQEFISNKLNISRPTYEKIEKGEKDITIKEAKKLASLFSISLNDFLNNDYSKKEINIKKKAQKQNKKIEQRIDVPIENIEKFKEVLLYILEKVGARYNIGETVLYKLLYFIDFDYYEKYEEQLMGAKYIKNHFGPTPVGFKKITDKMIKEKELERINSKCFQYEQKKYLPCRAPNLKILSAQEIQHIDEVLSRLAWKNANELSKYSHSDTPWRVHEDGEEISYESVFYRDNDHSVRNYEDEL